MHWLADNWMLIVIGAAAAIVLWRSGRSHRGCGGDGALPESRHAPRSGMEGRR